MSSTSAKGSQQTNKKTEKGFKNRELKSAEVCPGLAHRTVRCATGQCPMHQELQLRTTVRCTRNSNSELLTFGNSGGRSAISHRTVRCDSGATATSAPTVTCRGIKCAPERAEVRHARDGAPDTLQYMSGASPDSQAGPQDRAQRSNPNGLLT